MKLLCVLLVLSSFVAAQQVNQLQYIVSSSIQMMQVFKGQYSFMSTSLDQLIQGLTNVYYLQLSDSDLTSVGPYLTDIAYRFQSLPPNAAQMVQSSKLISLLTPLNNMKKLFPASASALNSNLVAYGGASNLFSAAIPDINKVIGALQSQ